MKNNRGSRPDGRFFIIICVAAVIGGIFLLPGFIGIGDQTPLFCSESILEEFYPSTTTPLQLDAILHYATSQVVPQQSVAEIMVSFDVLVAKAPCNFLIFGLGYDSLMWAAFNPKGKTLFLEEDPLWVRSILKTAPNLNVGIVNYRTKLEDADKLMKSYRSEPECAKSYIQGNTRCKLAITALPEEVYTNEWDVIMICAKSYIQGNTRCKLAITALPEEVYTNEWDVIMIDAPRGYFKEAPGRMGAIYSAAVMARNRKKPGVTHVFLHDVDRKVEKTYAEEFLCRKNLKKAVRRLWHFEIPPAENVTTENARFC